MSPGRGGEGKGREGGGGRSHGRWNPDDPRELKGGRAVVAAGPEREGMGGEGRAAEGRAAGPKGGRPPAWGGRKHDPRPTDRTNTPAPPRFPPEKKGGIRTA